jgi:hypothetical protein
MSEVLEFSLREFIIHQVVGVLAVAMDTVFLI